jgi:phage shock protein A
MAQHDLERGVQSTEQLSRDLVRDYPDAAKHLKALDLKVARLERLVDDLRRRVELLEADKQTV